MDNMPRPLANPDFTKLIATCVDSVKDCVKQQRCDEDWAHYVYEAAMEAVYGKEFWTWRNNQPW